MRPDPKRRTIRSKACGYSLDRSGTTFADIVEPFQAENIAYSAALDYYEMVENFERLVISLALEITLGHQTRAALLLNANFATLNSKINRLNIRPGDRFGIEGRSSCTAAIST